MIGGSVYRQSTQNMVYLLGGAFGGGGGSSPVVSSEDAAENALKGLKFYSSTSQLTGEKFVGGETPAITVSSVNGHIVELDVNSTPVSSLQALDDWDSI